MKNYDKNKETYLKYWDVNNSHEWTISERLPLACFK